MDYGVPGQNVAAYGEEEPQYEGQYEAGEGSYNIDGSAGIKQDSSLLAGKLFVGGIAWETSEESFNRYFRKYGEIADSVIMLDKISGRPRGFGFITFADPEVAERVIQEDHVIDGRSVEVKRTVPREDMHSRGGLSKTKKIFVGGLPLSLNEDDLREYFSSYGNIMDHQIMFDQTNGRSRGFGFVTFENEDAVEKILSDGRMHELGGKRVEIKRAEPKRSGFDHSFDNRVRRGGSSYKSSGNVPEGFDGGYGKMGRGYGSYGNYGGYGNFGGCYPGGFYPGYGYGYGYGFGGSMYNGGGFGGGGFGYGGPAGYGVGKGYGGPDCGYESYDGGKGFGGSGSGGGYAPAKGYGDGSGKGSGGRFHPYRK